MIDFSEDTLYVIDIDQHLVFQAVGITNVDATNFIHIKFELFSSYMGAEDWQDGETHDAGWFSREAFLENVDDRYESFEYEYSFVDTSLIRALADDRLYVVREMDGYEPKVVIEDEMGSRMLERQWKIQ